MSGARDAAKRETRRALLQAGLAEIGERGLDAPSLDDICARAGFTRGAFYVHFENREDFMVQLLNWLFRNFLDSIVTRDNRDGTLEEVVTRYVDALGRGRLPLARLGVRFSQVLEATHRLPPTREPFVKLLREAAVRVTKRVLDNQHRGAIRIDVSAEHLATVLVALSVGGGVLRDAGLELDLRPLRETVLRMVAADVR